MAKKRSPAVRGTLPTTEETCGVGDFSTGHLLGACMELAAGRDAGERVHSCTLRALSIPSPGDLDSEQGACIFFRELQETL